MNEYYYDFAGISLATTSGSLSVMWKQTLKENLS